MSSILEKTQDDWDCRALGQAFLEKFKEGGSLYPFIKLVKDHNELTIALRGNDQAPIDKPINGGAVIIYMKNHAMFTIHPKTVTINPNYLRYCEDWKTKLEEVMSFGFNKGQLIELGEVKCSINRRGEEAYTWSFKTDSISIPIETIMAASNDGKKPILDEVVNLMYEIFSAFFDKKEHQKDQFLLWANKHDKKYAGKIELRNKKRELEKERQQQLYSYMRSQTEGYFCYDMEYEQKHKSKIDKEEDKKNGLSNKPDMQAIRFDKDGKPAAWVFVEVKSTASAYGGTSGLREHIKKMRKYTENKENIKRRLRESYLVLHQLCDMGLIELEHDIDPSEFEKMKPEILVVLTDDAITCWEKDNDMDDYTVLNDPKYPTKLKDGTKIVLLNIKTNKLI